MFSQRFQREIRITRHAALRMIDRSIDEATLLELVDSGELRFKDAQRLWIFKDFAERDDNLLCAAVVLNDCLVVKTVMHHFESW